MSSQIVCAPVSLKGTGSLSWKIKRRQSVNPHTPVCAIKISGSDPLVIYAPGYGWATSLLDDDSSVTANCGLFRFEACGHHVVMKDLCADCGANLRREGGTSGDRVEQASAKIPMVHSIPELQVSESVAAELALKDEQALLSSRKLVLLVDLDETVLHTTNDPQAFNYQNVTRYRLPGSPLVYHTSFRPHLHAVLDCLAKYYEMHICTFGNRIYAHKLAGMIDPDRRYFSHRILSRDECFNPVTKSANLKALFPRGLNLVCIIDDRGEVWDWSPHLIQVKPYRFFQNALDVNTFPWSTSASIISTIEDSSSEDNCSPNSTSTASSDIICTATSESVQDVSVTGTPTEENPPTDSASPIPVIVPSQGPDTSGSELSVEKENGSVALSNAECNAAIISETDATAATSEDCLDKIGDKSQLVTDCSTSPCSSVDGVRKLDESSDDSYLLRLQDILITLHRRYYQKYDEWRALRAFDYNRSRPPTGALSDQPSDSPSMSSSPSSHATSPNYRPPEPSHRSPVPNLSDVIAELRTAVLGPSCHVTLSGLAPTNFHDRSVAGRIVRGLGAVLHHALRLPPNSAKAVAHDPPACSPEDAGSSNVVVAPKQPPVEIPPLSIYTTHLVACRRGTEKHIAALDFLRTAKTDSPSLHIVSPHWLWDCHFYWRHLPESDYQLVQDFHPSEFDPEVDPVPGTLRYARRHCRHRAECSPAARLTHVSSTDSAPLSSFQHHISSRSGKHHRFQYIRRRKFIKCKSDHETPDLNSSGSLNLSESTPQLDIGIVQSAIQSIRAELGRERKHKRRRMRRIDHHECQKNKSPSSEGKTLNCEQQPVIPALLTGSEDSMHTSMEHSAALALGTHCLTSASPDTVLSIASGETQHSVVISSEDIVEIHDAEDQDTSHTFNQAADDSAGDSTTEFPVEDEPSTESLLQSFLPPPKTLILADNPLMHLPPQAASQMLAEIEDAVIEEDTEKASSLPAEAELYDPATLGLKDSDSSLSDREFQSSALSQSDEVINEESHRSLRNLGKLQPKRRISPVERNQRRLQLQVQRELLIRRRQRASPEEVLKIDRKIRRLDASSLLTSRHKRSTDDMLLKTRSGRHNQAPINLSLSNDSDSELDYSVSDVDYHKYWCAEMQVSTRSRHNYLSRSSCRDDEADDDDEGTSTEESADDDKLDDLTNECWAPLREFM